MERAVVTLLNDRIRGLLDGKNFVMRHPTPILSFPGVALALFAVGCGQDESLSGRSAPVSTAPKQVKGGCGVTEAYRGANPEWTESAQVPRTPYALGRQGEVAAFLWARPLRAGHPQNPANKILWVVRLPRNGQSLSISGHPRGSAKPSVKYAAGGLGTRGDLSIHH
jgi:hypothetical protein